MIYIVATYDKSGSNMTSNKAPAGLEIDAIIKKMDASMAAAKAAGKEYDYYVIFDTVETKTGLGPMANKPVYSSREA